MATDSPQRIANALLDPIRNGTFPDSEDVLSASLDASGLSATLDVIRRSREEIRAEIQKASSRTSSRVDQWITQARQLQQDIEKSKRDARDIVQSHEAGKTVSARVEDVSAKVRFLHSETEYNEAILGALEDVKAITGEISSVGSDVAGGNLKYTCGKISKLEETIRSRISNENNRRVWTLVEARVHALRNRVLKELQHSFEELVQVGTTSGQTAFAVYPETEVGGKPTILKDVISALDELGALDDVLSKSSKKINRSLLHHLLSRKSFMTFAKSSSGQLVSEEASTRNLASILLDLREFITYVQARMPANEGRLLVSKSLQTLVPVLISDWLVPSVPVSLEELHSFQEERSNVDQFAAFLTSSGFKEATQVTEWINRIPRTWLTKRRTAALDDVRTAYRAYRGSTKLVERVEREKISKSENDLLNTAGWDDWDAKPTQKQEDEANKEFHSREEEDVSGWDFDGEGDQPTKSHEEAKSDADDDATEAWGWDDEDENPSKEDDPSRKSAKAHGEVPNGTSSEREMELRETYTVTTITDSILEIVRRQLQDAETITNDDFKWLHTASPAAGLRALPTLVLAMFRATAPSFYETAMPSGNMHIYNDCLHMADTFKAMTEETHTVNWNDDITSLEKFAKSAYAREMDLQRVVLRDLLDGAEGFAHCNEYPTSEACDTAVSSTVDHIRAIFGQWKLILSHSALLQSVGSLLATMIDKVIKDVEDMEDISEAESQRLVGYCNQISRLDTLFLPETPPKGSTTEEAVPLTAVYVTNWLKFQYLSNILESTLVDIKYLWTEGEMSLEFTEEEVIDLIKALFADSHHRRNAIADIRRRLRS